MPPRKQPKNARLIAQLNAALGWELRAQALYAHYAAYLKGLDVLNLESHFEEEATESFGHARKVREIIQAVGGEAVTTRDATEIVHTGDTRVMLEEALKTEQTAAATYKKIVALVKDHPVFYHTMFHIQKQELDSVMELERLLGR